MPETSSGCLDRLLSSSYIEFHSRISPANGNEMPVLKDSQISIFSHRHTLIFTPIIYSKPVNAYGYIYFRQHQPPLNRR
jgi:hypothetical protein